MPTIASTPPQPPKARAHAARRLPHPRTRLKWLHWGLLPFFVWFLFADPDAIRAMGPGWFLLHSVNGLIFVTLALIWTAWHLHAGLMGRPGPKLPRWGRVLHGILHRTLIWGLFLVAVGGFLLGLTSQVLLKAGGFLPIAPPLDLPDAHALASWFHVYQFYALGGVVALHAGFHLWRHVVLGDNALRIMVPRALHRWL
ncbi:cytochrome B [Roseibacterium sp. SDUM158016]|uniref:cytochrome B n=1 Tax=Roseicyclus sediminis TaxID=2980997 RepID=UPI0021D0EB83|nr:cytochrome B [Roseibacterium sp. SDUM158016]MCU4653820.1 cytochrome B [Roseibacterium sp. SDUM158016]